jgi:hypothetical protein
VDGALLNFAAVFLRRKDLEVEYVEIIRLIELKCPDEKGT